MLINCVYEKDGVCVDDNVWVNEIVSFVWCGYCLVIVFEYSWFSSWGWW